MAYGGQRRASMLGCLVAAVMVGGALIAVVVMFVMGVFAFAGAAGSAASSDSTPGETSSTHDWSDPDLTSPPDSPPGSTPGPGGAPDPSSPAGEWSIEH